MGNAYTMKNEIPTVVQNVEKALEIAKEKEYKQEECSSYDGLGNAYRLENVFPTEIKNYETALKILRRSALEIAQEERNEHSGNVARNAIKELSTSAGEFLPKYFQDLIFFSPWYFILYGLHVRGLLQLTY